MSTEHLSIVIPCKDDIEILGCIESIDYKHLEIVIVFNGSSNIFVKTVRDSLKKVDKSITIYELPKANIAWALEYGTKMARNDLILYMDSDCYFEKGSIKEFINKSKRYDVSENVFKGDVVFRPGRSKIERIISESRTHHTSDFLTAYKPPLMVSRKILTKIGGYAFNEKLIWREDSDLDNRIREASIKIIHVPNSKIIHHAISLKTDLRSTFRYGIGLAIANVLGIKLTEVPRSTMSAFKSKGWAVGLYMLFRNRIYGAGYVYARFRLLSREYLLEKTRG